jgi:hypothetical protein
MPPAPPTGDIVLPGSNWIQELSWRAKSGLQYSQTNLLSKSKSILTLNEVREVMKNLDGLVDMSYNFMSLVCSPVLIVSLFLFSNTCYHSDFCFVSSS